MMVIDQKGAVLYASQLINLLMARDATMVLGNPVTRAVLISLAQDLAAMVEGTTGEALQYRADQLRALTNDGGEIFIRGTKYDVPENS